MASLAKKVPDPCTRIYCLQKWQKRFAVHFASVVMINCWPNTSVKCHKG